MSSAVLWHGSYSPSGIRSWNSSAERLKDAFASLQLPSTQHHPPCSCSRYEAGSHSSSPALTTTGDKPTLCWLSEVWPRPGADGDYHPQPPAELPFLCNRPLQWAVVISVHCSTTSLLFVSFLFLYRVHYPGSQSFSNNNLWIHLSDH